MRATRLTVCVAFAALEAGNAFAVPRARLVGSRLAAVPEEPAAPAAGRADPATLVSALAPDAQRLAFGGICGGVLVGAAACAAVLGGAEAALPSGWFAAFRAAALPVPLGLVFAAAGAAHFALPDVFVPIVPPRGCWGGLWRVPAPGAEALGLSDAEYHCYWSGAAEFAGGLGLAAAGVGAVPVPVEAPALALCALVAAITPANVYMYTHDVDMGGGPAGPPPIPHPGGHYTRAAAQCVLLALLWNLAVHPSTGP